MLFAIWIGGGAVIWAAINSGLQDFNSYLMQLNVGNWNVVIDATSPVVLRIQDKLVSHQNMGINQSPSSNVSLGISGGVNLNDGVKISESEIQLVDTQYNVFSKGGDINYRVGNVGISNQGWSHLSIGPWWAALVNVNNGALRVNMVGWRPGCDANSVGLIVWDDGAQKLLVCEAKTDFYGRPIGGFYSWHQIAR